MVVNQARNITLTTGDTSQEILCMILWLRRKLGIKVDEWWMGKRFCVLISLAQRSKFLLEDIYTQGSGIGWIESCFVLQWVERCLLSAGMAFFWYQWNLDHGIKNRKDVLNTNGVFSQSISRGWEIENCSHHQLDLHPSLTKKPDSLARALNHFRCMNIIEYDMMFTVFGEI